MAGKFTFSKQSIDKLKFQKGRLNSKGNEIVQDIYWDDKETGLGLRLSPSGTKTFFFEGRLNRKIIRVSIQEPNLKQIRDKTEEYRSAVKRGIDPRIPKAKTGDSTFGNLLGAYVELLKGQHKKSEKAVKNAIKKHIQTAFPKIWEKQAAEITLDDCVAIVGRIKDSDKPRQADKVRSYIRTAFSEAINARGNVNMPASMRVLDIKYNPARDMRKVKGASQAKDRALSLAEFRNYWKRIQELPEPKRSISMLHVLTGGQRQQQLSRVTLNDIDRDAPSMTMEDFKGRRDEPRKHVIPLLGGAVDCIKNIGGGGEFVFSCDGGKKAIHNSYLNDIAKSVCKEMQEAGELEKEPFTAGTIRATIETRLIARPYSVSSDTLAHLLSHGLGGIQQRHYQHHDFFEEKLEALKLLLSMLNDTTVVPMRAVK
ncbi:MAG: integrase family protein [Gammaproteobacteria bacterium]|jgi:hypothetical protein|nr:integrase family protein [Gammaproteobacteria bacterium]